MTTHPCKFLQIFKYTVNMDIYNPWHFNFKIIVFGLWLTAFCKPCIKMTLLSHSNASTLCDWLSQWQICCDKLSTDTNWYKEQRSSYDIYHEKKARVVMTSAVKGDLSCFKSYTRTPEQFSVECRKPNQSNYFDQSQQRQSLQWTNQNLKQIHEAIKSAAKKINACELVTIDFGFTSNWLQKDNWS